MLTNQHILSHSHKNAHRHELVKKPLVDTVHEVKTSGVHSELTYDYDSFVKNSFKNSIVSFCFCFFALNQFLIWKSQVST